MADDRLHRGQHRSQGNIAPCCEAYGWWRVYRMGRVFGRDFPKGGQEQWYLRWDHGDDEQVVRGPYPSRETAVEASGRSGSRPGIVLAIQEREGTMTYPRLQIRSTTYRGEKGLGIYGKLEEHSWPIRVFVAGNDRAYAERVKARIIARAERIFED